MRYRSFLFLFVLFFAGFAALVSEADIRMTGPEVSASATADPGKENVVKTYDQNGNLLSTEKASYDLKVEAETEAYGNGWVGVRAEGSVDTGFQLNPSVSVEKVSFLIVFNEMETTTALARGNFITDGTGPRTLTGSGIAAVSAGGNSLSFSGGSWGIGAGEGRINLGGSTITDTASFTINLQTNTQGSGSGSGSGSSGSDKGCSNNPDYDYCTDTGSCTTRSGSGVPGECGHNYCCCAPYGSPQYDPNTNSGSSNNGNSNNDDDDSSSDDSSSTLYCYRTGCGRTWQSGNPAPTWCPSAPGMVCSPPVYR